MIALALLAMAQQCGYTDYHCSPNYEPKPQVIVIERVGTISSYSTQTRLCERNRVQYKYRNRNQLSRRYNVRYRRCQGYTYP